MWKMRSWLTDCESRDFILDFPLNISITHLSCKDKTLWKQLRSWCWYQLLNPEFLPIICFLLPRLWVFNIQYLFVLPLSPFTLVYQRFLFLIWLFFKSVFTLISHKAPNCVWKGLVSSVSYIIVSPPPFFFLERRKWAVWVYIKLKKINFHLLVFE